MAISDNGDKVVVAQLTKMSTSTPKDLSSIQDISNFIKHFNCLHFLHILEKRKINITMPLMVIFTPIIS